MLIVCKYVRLNSLTVDPMEVILKSLIKLKSVTANYTPLWLNDLN